MEFIVRNKIETRTDNPNLREYQVRLNGSVYIMCYEGEKLREVYFMLRFPKYFMSCRTDFVTISHYYITDSKTIIRYENGILNRTYHRDKSTTYYVDNGKKVKYILHDNIQHSLHKTNQLHQDLTTFLQEFYSRKLDTQFCPLPPTK